MQIKVLLSSGDEDTWTDVADAFTDAGSLIVISGIEGDTVPEGMKLVAIAKEIDNGPDAPPGTMITHFAVDAMYAPGMWMKVEYGAES